MHGTTIVDMFGVPGEDGSGTAHEFENGRAERKASVTSGKATWDASEWTVDNDSANPGGAGPVNAPGGFDPGRWARPKGGRRLAATTPSAGRRLQMVGDDSDSQYDALDRSCGDNVCDAHENWFNCEADCSPSCGNGVCECTVDGQWGSELCCFADESWCDQVGGNTDENSGSETQSSCPFDCGEPCAGGVCNAELQLCSDGSRYYPTAATGHEVQYRAIARTDGVLSYEEAMRKEMEMEMEMEMMTDTYTYTYGDSSGVSDSSSTYTYGDSSDASDGSSDASGGIRRLSEANHLNGTDANSTDVNGTLLNGTNSSLNSTNSTNSSAADVGWTTVTLTTSSRTATISSLQVCVGWPPPEARHPLSRKPHT